MPAFVEDRRAFSKDEVRRLADALLSSPLVGKSTLVGGFHESRGFAFTFTRAGEPALRARAPFLAPYLDRALDERRRRALLPLLRRRRATLAPCNAFYLNLLIVPQGGRVGRHVDATLRAPAGVPGLVPAAVSVVYLIAPRARGGRLLLDDEGRPRAAIKPRAGALVVFDGRLAHQVEPFSGGPPGSVRASLVCEQYVVPDAALARLPALRLHSKAGFDAYLDDAAGRAADLDVEG